MNKFRKTVSVLICICMILSLCGCGSDNTKKDKLTIAVRSGIYAEVIRKCIPGFEKKTGITCEIVEFSEEELRENLLNDSVNKNGIYDLCMIDGSWVAEFLADGILTDLSDKGYSFDEDIISATTSICISGDDIYLVPYYGNVTVLMYNKNAVAELGYTENDLDSLDDIVKFSLLAQENGFGGFACRKDSANNIVVDFLPILRAYGGWVVDKDNNPTVNTEEFRKALELYIFLIDNGKTASKEEIIEGIEDGNISVAIGWPGWCDPEVNLSTEYISIPGRVSDDSLNHNSNIYGIWNLGIPDNCTDKDSAMLLLEYLMDPDVQRQTVEYGGIPCRYSILNDPDMLSLNPHLEEICEALDHGIYRPVIKEWPVFYAILGDKMEKIIDGELSVDDGLLLAQTELEVLMK